jgi:hypothetical protein
VTFFPLVFSVSFSWMTLFSVPTPTPRPTQPVAPKVLMACDVVTKPDVELALGRHLLEAGWQVRSTRERCDYQAAGGQVTIRLENSSVALDPRTEFAALKNTFPGSQARELQGLGAPAMLLDLPEAGTQVFVIDGEHRYLLVSILGFGDPGRVSQAAERLAREAFKRTSR